MQSIQFMKSFLAISLLFIFVGCSENTVTRSNKVYLPPLCLTQSQTYLSLQKESPQTVILANSDCSELVIYTPQIFVEITTESLNFQNECVVSTQPMQQPVQNPQQKESETQERKPAPASKPKEKTIVVAHILIQNKMNTSNSYNVQLSDEFPKSKIYVNEATHGYELLGLPSEFSYKLRKDKSIPQKTLESNKGMPVSISSTTLCKEPNKVSYINVKIDELVESLQINHIFNYGKFKISTPIERFSAEIKDPQKPKPIRMTGPQ